MFTPLCSLPCSYAGILSCVFTSVSSPVSYLGVLTRVLTSVSSPGFLSRCSLPGSYAGVLFRVLTSVYSSGFLSWCSLPGSYLGVLSRVLTLVFSPVFSSMFSNADVVCLHICLLVSFLHLTLSGRPHPFAQGLLNHRQTFFSHF